MRLDRTPPASAKALRSPPSPRQKGAMTLSCTRSTALIVALGFALTALLASAQTTTWNLITPEEGARNDVAPQVAAPPDLPARRASSLCGPISHAPFRIP